MNATEFKQQVVSLSDRLYPMVARMLGNAETAEDAIQEIMIRLWDKRRQLKHHPNVPGFVFFTARNYCLDLLKKSNPVFEKAGEMHQSGWSENRGPADLEWKELNVLIQDVIKTLPDQQHEIITLRDLDGLEFKEIAGLTNLNVEHIRVLLSRARKQVALELKKIYSYEGKH
ncbi:RNA polymerase sigma factor [Saccharicrinis sp. FJH54]|uniref:RNA polymerase sigma factor n=1 Tax=Saccharicrinis sp. FJH54 TaxID=3344665 RepID=UPI0035D4EE7C